jgi:hypothetical protein
MSDNYRVFCLRETGVVTSSHWIDAKSDQEALSNARLLRDARLTAEVWRDARFVGRVDPEGQLETSF